MANRAARLGPVVVVLAALSLIVVSRMRSGGVERVPWAADLAAARRSAAAMGGRGMLLDFSATWCGPCQEMHRAVWPDRSVADALAVRWVPVKFDIDANPDAGRAYHVEVLPTLILTDLDGHELRRSEGYLSADELCDWLKSGQPTTTPTSAPSPSDEPGTVPR